MKKFNIVEYYFRIIFVSIVAFSNNMLLIGCTGESTPSQLVRGTSNAQPVVSIPNIQQFSPKIPNYQKRLALVIGNASYIEVAKLKNPINDSQDFAIALKKLGFEVEEKENIETSKEMRDVIRNFGDKLHKGGIGLFYYSGHGIQVNGENYLIPTTASLRSEADIGYEALGMRYIQDTLNEANNGMNIVILDACRDNPFARSIRKVRSTRGAMSTGLAQMESAKGSLIAFSTSPGATADDGSGRNGIFTKHLLNNIVTPGINVEGLFKRVRIGVTEETKGQQTPWESTSLTGEDFCFAGCENTTVTQARIQAEQATAEAARLRNEIEQQKLETERLKAETEALRRQHTETQLEQTAILKSQQTEAQQLKIEAAAKQLVAEEKERQRRDEQIRLQTIVAEQAQLAAQTAARQKSIEEQNKIQMAAQAEVEQARLAAQESARQKAIAEQMKIQMEAQAKARQTQLETQEAARQKAIAEQMKIKMEAQAAAKQMQLETQETARQKAIVEQMRIQQEAQAKAKQTQLETQAAVHQKAIEKQSKIQIKESRDQQPIIEAQKSESSENHISAGTF